MAKDFHQHTKNAHMLAEEKDNIKTTFHLHATGLIPTSA